VLAGAHLQQEHAQQEPRGETEAAARLGQGQIPGQTADLRRGKTAQIDRRQRDRPRGGDPHPRPIPALDERVAQDLVAPCHLGQGAAEHRDVELAREAHLRGDVVEGAIRLQALQEPEALLGEREREVLLALQARDRRLPEYMLPAAFVVLDKLPLSANGKVDRAALPPPGGARPGARRELVPPRTPEEKVLAAIWAQVLGVERVGVEDSFFEIGGDSLLAIQLISRVRDALRVELPMRELFNAMTVAAMARLVVAKETTPGLTRKLARILVTVQEMGAEDARAERPEVVA